MKAPARIDIICLGVSNVEESAKFYTEKLGWEIKSDAGLYKQFDTGGTTLAIYPLRSLAKEAGHPGNPVDFGGFTLAIKLDRAEDVDAVHQELVAKGVRILAEPRDTFWGGRSMYFSDVDGYVWEIIADR